MSGSTGRAINIEDEDTALELTPTEAAAAGLLRSLDAAFRTMRALDRAATAVEQHQGPRTGAEFLAKVERYRRAYAAWRETMQSFEGEAA